jgi:hypothetical protein
VKQHIPPTPGPGRDIDLRLITSTLHGKLADLGGQPATTFELIQTFTKEAFASAERLEALYDAVVASSAFPGAFEPVQLTVDGEAHDCIDGGATSNAPIGEALSGSGEIDRVFLIVPYPRDARMPNGLGGITFIARLADVLIQERLFRDLGNVYLRNSALAALAKIEPDGAKRAAILAAFGVTNPYPVEVVEIRPAQPLDGNALSGLFSKRLREDYVQQGFEDGRRILAGVDGRARAPL